MVNYPQILYWKWDESIFENNNLENKLEDIFNRSDFDMIYVSFHWLNLPFTDEKLIGTIEKCCNILHQKGKKFMLDIDIRNEGKKFMEKYPGHHAWFTYFLELQLDGEGRAEAEYEPVETIRWGNKKKFAPTHIINAWVFNKADDDHFEPSSLKNAKQACEIVYLKDGKWVLKVNAGSENAGKRILAFPAIPHVMPDFYSPHFYEYFSYMYDKVKHIPLDGVGVDEWGYSLTILYDKENGVHVKHLPYSPYMAEEYGRRYGESLNDVLLYLRYAPLGEEGKRLSVINNYIENFRDKMGENEDWVYHKGKEAYGKDTFISAHPTWWGSENCCYLEIPYNGFDWWQATRDYAQSDEQVLLPIRFALAHKWGGKVWYNMFYKSAPADARHHIRETWRNARFGGRTHQLGYECPNEGIIEFRNGDLLEQVWEMEKEITKLNAFQQSQPDSRVLIVFGMEAVTNWELGKAGYELWRDYNPVMTQTFQFAKGLFTGGWLCDLVPSSEVARGSVKLVDGKAKYGTQEYDAVVLINPQCVKKDVLAFFNSYLDAGGKLIVMGDCTYFADGSDASGEFKELAGRAQHHMPADSGAETVQGILRDWGVPGNRFENGCILQDGSAIFAAEGLKSKGNPLIVNCSIKGHQVEFEGEDFLGIDLDGNGQVSRIAYGSMKRLAVDGKPYAV